MTDNVTPSAPRSLPEQPDITSILTPEEVILCGVNWSRFQQHSLEHPGHNHSVEEFTQAIADKVIAPVIDRINTRLGQENDPLYLAMIVTGWLEEQWDEFLEKQSSGSDPLLLTAAREFQAHVKRMKAHAKAKPAFASYLN